MICIHHTAVIHLKIYRNKIFLQLGDDIDTGTKFPIGSLHYMYNIILNIVCTYTNVYVIFYILYRQVHSCKNLNTRS